MKLFLLTMMTATLLMQAQTIHQRKENQQDRIANGVKNGSLTAGETANLEHKESRLNKEIRTDRKVNGGNLTNNEKKQVNRQQNRLSTQIYNDKHNAAHQSK
jgi:metal-dependent amidase/aminoacylase/carboxypeptidase family protein